MPPIRILHVITGLGRGGAETWLVRLLSRLPRERFDCRVVSLLELNGEAGALAADLRALGLQVDSLGLRRGLPSLGAVLQLLGILRQWRPQVVQSWLYHADLLSLLAVQASGCGARVSWGLRCAYMDFSRYGLGTRLTMRACAALSGLPQAITANSHAGAAHHVALGYRSRRLVVLENGVDGAVFRPDAAARTRLRAEWGVEDTTVLVGLVARVDPMKGHGVFCQAAARVLRAFPQARFVFCGQGTGADEGAVLGALLTANGLDSAAIRLGQRADVPAVLAALDVLAVASLGEGFPNVLVEALACGVPVASLDVGDARRILGVPDDSDASGASGGLVAAAVASGPGADDQAQAGALAACLGRVLGFSPEARAAMGAAGRAHVLAHHGLGKAVARWAAHFEALAGENLQRR